MVEPARQLVGRSGSEALLARRGDGAETTCNSSWNSHRPSGVLSSKMTTVLVACGLFTAQVLAADRVSRARVERTEELKQLVARAGLRLPLDRVYLRVFKEERELELWGADAGKPMTLVKRYPICAASGEAGPKRREGDLQVPEGFYQVSGFNPVSDFHLAMKVSYPNASDRIRSDREHPGGLIFLHGDCASVGCIAIEDGPIEELYLLSLDSRRRPIHIDIFPFRMTEERLELPSPHQAFWNELYQGELEFQRTHRPPDIAVDGTSGAYRLRAR
jgi:murein L,D-transpeptidase YafK